MTGRTPAEAVRRTRDALQRVVSCVSRAVLVVSTGGYGPGDEPHGLSFRTSPALLTGAVTLQDVVRLVIRDFGVRPLRLDWARVLDETRASAGL